MHNRSGVPTRLHLHPSQLQWFKGQYQHPNTYIQARALCFLFLNLRERWQATPFLSSRPLRLWRAIP